jgi:hypothetical protein
MAETYILWWKIWQIITFNALRIQLMMMTRIRWNPGKTVGTLLEKERDIY